MRTVALVGFAETTRSLAYRLPPDVELWTLNRGWQFQEHFTRIDRLFEMHDLPYLSDPNNADTKDSLEKGELSHWSWMRQPHDWPIYTLEAYPEIPGSVAYPLEAVSRDVYDHLWRAQQRLQLFSSTFDFMLALAIYEMVDQIRVYGFEMGTRTEYAYQRDSGMLLLGIAAGRGIDVVVPQESQLIPHLKLYGYQGAQMITRQTLEAYKRTAEGEKEKFKALANARIGILQFAQGKPAILPEELEKVRSEHMEALRMLDKWDGVLQILDMLIGECDMLEITPDIVQTVPILPFDGGNHGDHHGLG